MVVASVRVLCATGSNDSESGRFQPRGSSARGRRLPDLDGLPVSPLMRRNRRVTESLLEEFKREGQLSESLHVHGQPLTVGY
jgi:hypothetical protein